MSRIHSSVHGVAGYSVEKRGIRDKPWGTGSVRSTGEAECTAYGITVSAASAAACRMHATTVCFSVT